MQGSIVLRDILIFVFKHKFKILTVFLVIAVLEVVIIFRLPSTYEAKSTLLRLANNKIDLGRLPEESISSEIAMLTSRDLFEKVINTLGIKQFYPSIEETLLPPPLALNTAVSKFESSLAVARIAKSDMISISFQHTEPQLAATAVNLLVSEFLEKRKQYFNNPETMDFLSTQVTTYKQKLEQLEKKFWNFQQTYPAFSDTTQRNLLVQQHVNLDTSLKETQNKAQELKHKLAFYEQQIKLVSEMSMLRTEVDHDSITSDVSARLLGLQLQETQLLEKYKENHPKIVEVRKEIQLAKDFLKNQKHNTKGKTIVSKNDTYDFLKNEVINIKGEIASQEAKEQSILSQISQLGSDFQSLVQKEKTFLILQRQIEMAETNLRTYMKKLEEARISTYIDQQNVANVRVVKSAVTPLKPVKPRKKLSLIIGTFVAVVCGLGIALITEFLSQTFSTPESIEQQLGLPVLVAIPYKLEAKRQHLIMRRRIAYTVGLLLLAVGIGCYHYRGQILSQVEEYGLFRTIQVPQWSHPRQSSEHSANDGLSHNAWTKAETPLLADTIIAKTEPPPYSEPLQENMPLTGSAKSGVFPLDLSPLIFGHIDLPVTGSQYATQPEISFPYKTQHENTLQRVTGLLREFFPDGGDFQLRVWTNKGEKALYEAGESLIVYIESGTEAYVRVDYYQADGQVIHLLPNSLDNNFITAGHIITLGKSKGGLQFTLTPPFGTEMLTVIASQHPFIETTISLPVEPAEAYIQRLGKLIESAQSQGKVAVAYAGILTREAAPQKTSWFSLF